MKLKDINGLDEVRIILNKYVESLDSIFMDKIKEALSVGKMLRSKLILNIAGNNQDAFVLSAVIELIHLASLLHDDVIDNANFRRFKTSFNFKYGSTAAIMLGDIFYSKGYYEMSFLKPPIPSIISEAVTKLAIGELEDVWLSDTFCNNISTYLKVISFKTASLIEASTQSAAIIANKDIEAYKSFGQNIGMAFQIIDDLLDINGDAKTLGKPNFSDFKEGKSTAPYIYLYDNSNDEERAKLLSMFKREITSEDIHYLTREFEDKGVIHKVQNLANNYILQSKEAIQDIRQKDNLEKIIDSVIHRNF